MTVNIKKRHMKESIRNASILNACILKPHQWGRLILALGVVLGLLFSVVQPASADGPLVPGYYVVDGKRIPAPTGYVQTNVFMGENQPCGAFLNPTDLFLDPATGNLLVADTGNNRVVVLDNQGKYLYEIGGEKAGLNTPEGVFVNERGEILIADKGNKRVAVFMPDGTLIAEHTKPDSTYLTDIDFNPSKIVVDKRGFLYIVTGSENKLGVLVVDSTERFRGFFGRTRIPFNLGRVIARFLSTDVQKRKMMGVQPAPLGNLFLDSLGFIYAVSPVLKIDQIQRLNSVGTNVFGDIGTRIGAGKLWDKLLGKEGIVFGETEVRWGWNDAMRMSVPQSLLPQFVDLGVDDLGIVTVIDSRNDQIYQYDQSGNLLTVFGGSGMSAGFLQTPISIVAGGGGIIYILDGTRGNIQVFRPTELTRMIHQAAYEYFNGDYDRAAQLWAGISERDTNFPLAHSGLGKALMGKKQFVDAMQQYYYAEDKDGYSAAFGEYRYLWMRARFGWLGAGFIGVVIATGITWNRALSGFRRLIRWLSTLRERAGIYAVPVLLVMTILSWMVSLSVLSFHFRTRRPDEIRLLFESGKLLLPWITWCVSAYGIGEIFFGEGTFRNIVIHSAWALWPLIFLPIPVNLITNVITRDEKSIYNVLWYIIWGLLVIQFLIVVVNVHKFELGQAIPLMGLMLVGMIAIWVLLGLIFALTSEIVRFVSQLALELYVRLY